LLDFRASIDLPSAEDLFSGDDIARYDLPAAITAIREISGADSVQVVAHCFGSTVFTMSMLGGWATGVRSAVCSQVSAHLHTPRLTRAKAGIHLSGLLKALGTKSLTAYTDRDASWSDRFFDDMLRLYPIEAEERCDSPVCHRITFLYGLLYEHDQLNLATHDSLHELFGMANIATLDHLLTMVRHRTVVAHNGVDAYLPHADRMAIPITFISGAENGCFLPKSTERTHRLFSERNGPDLYRRHVVPNYGHIDCIIGKNAARDVFPLILAGLEQAI
jgi:cholesterol oxidase